MPSFPLCGIYTADCSLLPDGSICQRPRQAAEGGICLTADVHLAVACPCPTQAHGQAVKRVLLPSAEDPVGTVPALAVADADGWQFCLVAPEREAAGLPGGVAAMEE